MIIGKTRTNQPVEKTAGFDEEVVSQATELVEGGTLDNAKPIYWHTIYFQRGGSEETSEYGRIFGSMIILNNSVSPITLTNFITLLQTNGFVAVVFNGQHDSAGASNLENMTDILQYIEYNSENTFRCVYRNKTTNVENYEDLALTLASFASFEDLGANKIN